MGWTFSQSTYGLTPKAYIDRLFTFDNEQARSTVLKSTRIGSVYYAAVETTRKDDGSHSIWAAVCLTKSCPRAKDGYTFGYKDMCESMGPREAKCPPGILDLLTETSSDYAIDWRKRCREHAALKSKLVPKPGSVLRFAEALPFTDQTSHSEFTLVTYTRRGRNRTAFRAGNGKLYRIPNFKALTYSVHTPGA